MEPCDWLEVTCFDYNSYIILQGLISGVLAGVLPVWVPKLQRRSLNITAPIGGYRGLPCTAALRRRPGGINSWLILNTPVKKLCQMQDVQEDLEGLHSEAASIVTTHTEILETLADIWRREPDMQLRTSELEAPVILPTSIQRIRKRLRRWRRRAIACLRRLLARVSRVADQALLVVMREVLGRLLDSLGGAWTDSIEMEYLL